jgi:hypothetical protein
VPYFNRAWRHYQERSTDMQRMLPLYYIALTQYPDLAERPQVCAGLPACTRRALHGMALYGSSTGRRLVLMPFTHAQAPHLPAPQPLYAVKSLFHEHDGIQPFWNLGLTDAYVDEQNKPHA